MEHCLDFGARVRNKALFIAKYVCIDTSAGCLLGQGACLACLLFVRDVQVFPEQSTGFFQFYF